MAVTWLELFNFCLILLTLASLLLKKNKKK